MNITSYMVPAAKELKTISLFDKKDETRVSIPAEAQAETAKVDAL